MKLKLNSVYKHYKGNHYKTLLISHNSDNLKEPLVIYQALYKDEEFGEQAIWARPISEFGDLHDGKNPRFEFVCELPLSNILQ